MTTTADRIAQLKARMVELRDRLRGIETELDSHQSQDWEDLATERESDEVLEGMGLTGQQELRQIEAALARADAGEFGICVKCGEKVSNDRLDLLPQTPHCRNCAA